MDSRHTRGRALAESGRVKHVDGPLWFVPSEKAGGWIVDIEAGTCQCPDHTGQKVRCKHLHAVAAMQSGLVKTDGAQATIAFPPLAKALPRGGLTAEERDHIRAAMRFLRARCGGTYEALAKAMRVKVTYLRDAARRRTPNAGLAVRLARFAGVSIDDVIAGRFPPPGACPHCGQIAPAAPAV